MVLPPKNTFDYSVTPPEQLGPGVMVRRRLVAQVAIRSLQQLEFTHLELAIANS